MRDAKRAPEFRQPQRRRQTDQCEIRLSQLERAIVGLLSERPGCAGERHQDDKRYTESEWTCHVGSYRLVTRRAERDPASENQDLSVGQEWRPCLGHAATDD